MTGISHEPHVGASDNVPAPTGMFRVAARRYSVLVPKRVALVSIVLTLMCAVLGFAALGLGSSHYSYADVLDVLSGGGSRAARLVVLEWRIPRIVLALAVGAALGMAGSIFQALTRNPLGSPDLIGFTMGAQTGILVAVFFGAGFVSTSVASLIGGVAVGALIYALSFRGGFGGLRLILAGIAVTAMLGSVNRWLILRTDPDTAFGAVKAVTGSLASADSGIATSCTIAIVAAGAIAMLRSRDLRALDLARISRCRSARRLAGRAQCSCSLGPRSLLWPRWRPVQSCSSRSRRRTRPAW